MPKFDDSKFSAQLKELRQKEEEGLIAALSDRYGHSYIDLHGVTIDTDALKILEEHESREAETVVFSKNGSKLSIAMRNPKKKEAQTILERLTAQNYTLTLYMCSSASLLYAWERYNDIRSAIASERGVLSVGTDAITRIAENSKTIADVAREVSRVAKSARSHQVSEALEVILGGATALKASDVHIEPEEKEVRIRYRLDGVLTDITDIPHEMYELLRSRLKLLSGLKLNRSDIAQDGRFSIKLGKIDEEIRSSIIPGGFGESIVMRLLDPSTTGHSIEKLGINAKLLAVIEEEIRRPNGMILTTGPTGSGKTTTLYAFLKRIYSPEIKIITLEDPIEYKLEGVVQTQVEENYSFSAGLRAILRQDPDVLMIGEIRDREVAETAINSALTGHLVFSTLHTNSAVGAFPRLLDLGVDSNLIGSAVNLALAQRLLRMLCPHCKRERKMTEREREIISRIHSTSPLQNAARLAEGMVYESVGCEQCAGTGFKGRIGIYEGIRMDSKVELAIIHDPREEEILSAARHQEIPLMQEDGVLKVLDGTTSFEELERVIDLTQTE